jgi:AraC-like DNA-binding protein
VKGKTSLGEAPWLRPGRLAIRIAESNILAARSDQCLEQPSYLGPLAETPGHAIETPASRIPETSLLDRLSQLLERFPLRASVFYTGGLCGIYDFDRDRKPGHFHCIKSGSVELIDGHEHRIVSEPSIVFMPSAGSHRLVTGGASVEAICATVHFGAANSSPVIGALPRVLVVPIASAARLEALCEAMFEEVRSARDGRQAALNRLCELSVVELMRIGIGRKLVSGGTLAGLNDPRISKALESMHELPSRDWSLVELATLAGMSRARFSLNFRSVVGVTPGDHLTACRVAAAQELLRQGLALKAVAERVGYGSASALTRAFTRVSGSAPAHWLAALERRERLS